MVKENARHELIGRHGFRQFFMRISPNTSHSHSTMMIDAIAVGTSVDYS